MSPHPTALLHLCRPFKWINIPRSPGAQGIGARRGEGQTGKAVRAPAPPFSRKQIWLSHSINTFFSPRTCSVSCQVSFSLPGGQIHDRHRGTKRNQNWGYHIPQTHHCNPVWEKQTKLSAEALSRVVDTQASLVELAPWRGGSILERGRIGTKTCKEKCFDQSFSMSGAEMQKEESQEKTRGTI